MEEGHSGAGTSQTDAPGGSCRRRGRTDLAHRALENTARFPRVPTGPFPITSTPNENPEKHRSLGLLEPLQPISDPHELQESPKYRVGWREYERALVQRGDVTLWLSADVTDAWKASPSGRPGGQQRFSDLAIETALSLRLVFRLPLRQTEGFLRSVLALMRADLEAPDHTTLSRRSQRLDVELHRIPANEPVHLIVDSTGLSIVGEGEWAAAKHGGRGQRGWKKLHLAVDRAGAIVAHALTESAVDDATTGIGLIAAVADEITRAGHLVSSTMPPLILVPKSTV